MGAATATSSQEQPKAYKVILMAGLIAGALDITAASVNSTLRGRGPIWVLQSVASGVLGADSYNGGLASAALGLALHFLIATGAAAVYYAASRRLKLLVNRAIVCGLIYGVAVYLFMNLIVLPITFGRITPYPLAAIITGLVIHMLCVGLPIALVVRHYSK